MNKRFYIRFVALLMVFVCTVILMPVTTTAGTDGNATLVKSYNKDGKFSMVIDLTTPDNGFATFEIFLTDANGNVYTRWNNISSSYTSGTRQYTFSRSYANTPEGQYKMNVVATNAYGNSKNFSWVVNHKKTIIIAFKDTYKVKNADGTYSQQFNFTSVNGKGKTFHVELYTNDGKFIKSFSYTASSDNSNWWAKWNYYPDKGVKMKSGSYILKYWVDGGNPKQTTITISI
ncbi:hypothetical protein Desor_3823 [Desulfosporosinus orientis DSM 765]|uniref:FlgD Ig-like domain-containing protein n=1 Tax=Desulfosporosinus orientis (strain ATCC 19365 / DSM 765 / NCIMB 8382 / VKM B-1628 / Singapore I) TaxID=768706 RepID=G7W9E5_DESOD|nr:hypothetical protein [Desulfosporosinus orientis]AET69282.1 hypothetical protein Desor_3823 [Desulfosporosinus orientis DSM 765]